MKEINYKQNLILSVPYIKHLHAAWTQRALCHSSAKTNVIKIVTAFIYVKKSLMEITLYFTFIKIDKKINQLSQS